MNGINSGATMIIFLRGETQPLGAPTTEEEAGEE